MMILFGFTALWVLQLHVDDVKKIQYYKKESNDTMLPILFMLNIFTAVPRSKTYGRKRSVPWYSGDFM
jgi:hypothetical protein